jgi:putative membrane protein
MRLAAERTLLAWIRTGLAMMGFGFVVARFGLFLREMAAVEHKLPEKSTGLSLWVGTALLVMGVLVNVISALEYRAFLGRYQRGEPDDVPKWSLGVSTAVLLAALGIAMIAYLLAI